MSSDYLILAVIGLLAGVLGGLLGIGGSVLMIPAMSLVFGPAQHLYQGAAMMVNFFVVAPAVVQHRRAGAILGPVVRVTAPAAVLGVVVGVWLSSGPWFQGDKEVYLSRTFGAFMLYAAGYNLYRLRPRRPLPDIDHSAARSIPWWKTASMVGLPMGLAAGLLGIGGGSLAVPLQQVFLRIPLRRAIANSAATIVLLSLVGAGYKNYSNTGAGVPFPEALKLAMFLIPTALIGGYFGGRLTHTLPRRTLRLVVVVLMIYGGISLIRRPAAGVPLPAAIDQTAHRGGCGLGLTRRSCARCDWTVLTAQFHPRIA